MAEEGAYQGLRIVDVRRLWGQERARAAVLKSGGTEAEAEAAAQAAAAAEAMVSKDLVGKALQRSRRGHFARRGIPVPRPWYPHSPDQDNPVSGDHPIWVPRGTQTIEDVEASLRAWWHRKPGPGDGGGRPRTKPRRCSCGCGETLAPGDTCTRDREAAALAGAA